MGLGEIKKLVIAIQRNKKIILLNNNIIEYVKIWYGKSRSREKK